MKVRLQDGSMVFNLMKGLREDCIYRLKVLVLGDKGVGKTSIVLSFIHGQQPTLLPNNEDLAFYSKREEYPLTRLPTDRDLFDSPKYQCRFHIWDISGAATRDALANFRAQKFYQTTVALIYVFKDEASFEFLKRSVFSNIPRLQITNRQAQFLVYNPFRESFSRSLEQQAKALAPKEYIYMKLQPSDVSGIRKLFQTILEQSMFKIKDGILSNALLRDRDNNVVLRNRRSKEEHERKYNRCC